MGSGKYRGEPRYWEAYWVHQKQTTMKIVVCFCLFLFLSGSNHLYTQCPPISSISPTRMLSMTHLTAAMDSTTAVDSTTAMDSTTATNLTMAADSTIVTNSNMTTDLTIKRQAQCQHEGFGNWQDNYDKEGKWHKEEGDGVTTTTKKGATRWW